MSEAPEFTFPLPAGTTDVSLSRFGGKVALATQTGAILVDLEGHDQPGVHSWRVAQPDLSLGAFCLAFNPHPTCEGQLAVASDRSVSLVEIHTDGHVSGGGASVGSGCPSESGRHIGVVRETLRAHLRPVNALDWSPHAPHLLATCAEDCRFFVWDVRQPQPAHEMLPPASWTSSVRWSALSEPLLATGHEDTVCVWDIRNASQQMSVLAPGQSRVLTVDWSHHDAQKLLSVSASEGGSTNSGSIKLWDLGSPHKVHESIDIENGLPGAARFLPFGPAILAAVQSLVVIFSVQVTSKAQVLNVFSGHKGSVNAVTFSPCGSGGHEWRLVSMSGTERKFRSWRYRVPQDLSSTVICPTGVLKGSPSWLAEPPDMSPVRSLGADAGDVWFMQSRDGEQYLGGLAKQHAKLRRLECVDEVASYREQSQELLGQVEEYQLGIEITTNNNIRLRITVGVDPTAPMTRAAMGRAMAPVEPCECALGHGLRVAVKWDDKGADQHGPLAPGIVDETFGKLSLANLLNNGDDLCRCVEALIRMLHRRDHPPLLTELGAGLPAASPRKPSRAEIPFPRTCGMCWSPQGDLFCFRSLRNIVVPFPRRWTFTDYKRVLKIHRERGLRITDDEDKLSAAALQLNVDQTVHIVPSTTLCGLVEDNWWSMVMPLFDKSSPSESVGEVCRSNSNIASGIGRDDLAELWRVMAFLIEGHRAADLAPDWPGLPFATRLVQQIVQQLFESKETMTVAMLAGVLYEGGLQGSEFAPSVSCTPPMESRARQRRANQKPFRHLENDLDNQVRGHCISDGDVDGDSYLHANSMTCPPDFAGLMGSARIRPQRGSVAARRQARLVPFRERANPASPESAFSEPRFCSSFTIDTQSPAECYPEVPTPKVWSRPCSQAHADLIPRDMPTLERLLHSAYAHCDLLHRLGEFRTSRVLAKLLHKLRDWHELPLLDAAGKFGFEEDGEDKPASTGRPVSGTLGSSVAVCFVCCERVRTLYVPCWLCGHGSHIACFRKWFTSPEQKCPAIGCDCRCMYLRPVE